MEQYLDLLRHVLAHGTRKENRTGVDTLSTFNYNYKIDLADGFPILTTKRVNFKNIVIELLWFLSGSNESAFLDRHKCGFWKPWYNADGTVNAAYGPAWRRFEFPDDYPHICEAGTGYNDQIQWAVDKLKTKPMSRDIVISAWQPHIAQKPPSPNAYWAPCHTLFILNVQNDENVSPYDEPWEAKASFFSGTEFLGVVWAVSKDAAYMKARTIFGDQTDTDGSDCLYVQEPLEHNMIAYQSKRPPTKRLCLHLTQRSADICLGIPYNIVSYSLLLHLFARFAGLEVGSFAHSLVDAHIYTAKPDGDKAEFDHVPGALEQLTRPPGKLPKLVISDKIQSLEDVERLLDPSVTTEEIMSLFVLEGYEPALNIAFKVAP